MKKIREIISYLYPEIVVTRTGSVTPYLEVIKFRGKYALNSSTVNYSFGGLHVIFDRLFQKIGIKKLEFKNVLILGMGAGSIISLLRKKYKTDCSITAVEKDEVVIEIAREYFDIEKYDSLKIIHEDAFKYISGTDDKYDLIISDLFIDADVPEIFASNEYLANLKRIAKERCCVIYNKMTQQPVHKKELIQLSLDFQNFFPGFKIHYLNTYNSENSLLYYNTLPISVRESHPAENHSRLNRGPAIVSYPSFTR